MDKKIVFFTLVLIFAITAGNQQTWVEITNIKVSPSEIYAGDTFLLKFQVRNILNIDVSDFSVQIQAPRPFEDLSGTVSYIGDLGPNESKEVRFRIRVDDNTLEGTYPITVLSTMEGQTKSITSVAVVEINRVGFTATNTINIRVDGRPEVVSSPVSFTPTTIYDDSDMSVTIKLYNNGTTTAENVKISTKNTKYINAKATTQDIFVGDIKAQSHSLVTLYYHIPGDTVKGTYTIPYSVKYEKKEMGYSFNDVFDIEIDNKDDEEPILDISLISSVPKRLAADDIVTLTFLVTNTGEEIDDEAQNIMFELQGKEHIIALDNSNKQSLGTLPAQKSTKVMAQIYIDSEIEFGKHSITASIISDTATVTKNIPIKIEQKAPFLFVSLIDSHPKKIYKGDTVTLTFSIHNSADERWDIAEDVIVSAHSKEPLSIHYSSDSKMLGDIAPKASMTYTITVEVDENAKPGKHPLYAGHTHNKGSGERLFEIEVEEKSDFEIINSMDSVYPDSKDIPVQFTIKNTGSVIAEEVKVTLLANYPFTPTGKTFFAKNIAPEESRDITFHIDVDSDATAQDYPVELYIEWKENDDIFALEKGSFVTVIKKPETEKRKPYLGIVGAIILVLGIITLINKRTS